MTRANAYEIATRHDAEALLVRIGETMIRLVSVVETETRLLQKGHIAAAAELTPEKTELAALYLHDYELLKANMAFIARTVPALVDEIRRAHASFREIIGLNLRVAATAHGTDGRGRGGYADPDAAESGYEPDAYAGTTYAYEAYADPRIGYRRAG
jgi:hypothetical protein